MGGMEVETGVASAPPDQSPLKENKVSEEAEEEVLSHTESGEEDVQEAGTSKRRKKREPFDSKCPECGRQFHKRKQLHNHLYYAHGTGKKWRCEECDLEFRLKHQFDAHQKRHQGYTCKAKDCTFVATSFTELRRHAASLHPRSHACNDCGRSFHRPAELRRHEALHTDDVPCPLPGCQKRVLASRLNAHLRNAHGQPKTESADPDAAVDESDDEPAADEVGDEPAVYEAVAAVANAALDAEDPGRVFLCPVKDCGSILATRAGLRRHRREVHDKAYPTRRAKFRCTHEGCTSSFTQAERLETHLNFHAGHRPYACPKTDCPRAFCGREGLARHVREAHDVRLADLLDDAVQQADLAAQM